MLCNNLITMREKRTNQTLTQEIRTIKQSPSTKSATANAFTTKIKEVTTNFVISEKKIIRISQIIIGIKHQLSICRQDPI